MRPIEFPEANQRWAEDQEEYETLPAFRDGTLSVSCWRLSFRERLVVFFTGRLWLAQLHFGRPLQPQRPSVERPPEIEGD